MSITIVLAEEFDNPQTVPLVADAAVQTNSQSTRFGWASVDAAMPVPVEETAIIVPAFPVVVFVSWMDTLSNRAVDALVPTKLIPVTMSPAVLEVADSVILFNPTLLPKVINVVLDVRALGGLITHPVVASPTTITPFGIAMGKVSARYDPACTQIKSPATAAANAAVSVG